MGRAQSDTYSSLFTKSDNVNLDETFDRKSLFVHVLIDRTGLSYFFRSSVVCVHSGNNVPTKEIKCE